MRTTRRVFLQSAAGASAALLPLPRVLAQPAAPQVVVVGGGFAGASCARALKRLDQNLQCHAGRGKPDLHRLPVFSNSVIAGLRDLSAQQFGYERVVADGIVIAPVSANRRRRAEPHRHGR